MRTIAFVSMLALASGGTVAPPTVAPAVAAPPINQRRCILDSAEAVSDAIDSAIFIWAATKRCQKDGETIRCAVNAAAAVKSVNSMVNVIMHSISHCGHIDMIAAQCGAAVSELTEHTAGIAATGAGIAEKCVNHTAQFDNWGSSQPVMCMVDTKSVVKNLMKAVKHLFTIKSTCDGVNEMTCVNNALSVVAAIGGMGAYVAGAVGHCSPDHKAGAACTAEVGKFVQQLAKVSRAGMDIFQACPAAAVPAVAVEPAPARLYSQAGAKVQPAKAGILTLALAAFLPVTAVVSFVGGRFYAKRQGSQMESRDFMMSDVE